MNPTRDLERRIADYYAAEAPARAPDWLLTQALDTVDTTSQRRIGLGRPWRLPPRTPVARLAVAGVAIIAVGLVGLTLQSQPSVGPAASPSSTPVVSVAPAISGGMWPQSSLDDVRQAQALADAGDPAYTWQVSRSQWYQPGQHHPMSTVFFARFIEAVLGWEDFRWDEAFAHPAGLVDGDVVYIRCAPDRRISLYPEYAGCAPTIDGSRYETVKINVAQLIREGPSGIWVVTGWEMIGSSEETAPPSDAEISASLGAFLQARIDGAGAEDFVDVAEGDQYADERVETAVPLLYATTTGAAYARSEFELMDGPTWPEGAMQFKVRLFADDDDTVVEQLFGLERDETGRLRVVYEFHPLGVDGPIISTTENGEAVPVTYGFLDGAVTYRAAHPLAPSLDVYRTADRVAIEGELPEDDFPRRVLVMVADPRPFGQGCVEAQAADAEALARSIESDSAVEATAPVAVTVGGIQALRMDMVLVQRPGSCSWSPFLHENAPAGIDRARLYLVDLPGGSGRVLALATITDEDSFETVLDWAEPVVASIEFHAP